MNDSEIIKSLSAMIQQLTEIHAEVSKVKKEVYTPVHNQAWVNLHNGELDLKDALYVIQTAMFEIVQRPS
jgi:regulator of replication initiation timing